MGVLKQTGSAANNNLAVTLYNVYADHIDTPRLITRQDHTIVWRWDTAEAFGATPPDQNPSGLGAFLFNQRFAGQVFDSETGLNQNVNREYDPRTGRYRQFDPLGLAAGINGFAYVGGNPLSRIDFKGLNDFDITDASQIPAGEFSGYSVPVTQIADIMQEGAKQSALQLLLAPVGAASVGVVKIACEIPAYKYGMALLTATNLWSKVPKLIPKLTPELKMSAAQKTLKQIAEASKTAQPQAVATQPYP